MPDTPLTDEELAEMAERLEGDDDVERLIADLRASRAEVERLRGKIAHDWDRD